MLGTIAWLDDVPLLIPEVNSDHLGLLERQASVRAWAGRIVTNPNCSTIMLAMALAPLRRFGLQAVNVTTLQAVSGAGYPGVASLNILGNVIPYIGGEEEKIETETKKVLGTLRDGVSMITQSWLAPTLRGFPSLTDIPKCCPSGLRRVHPRTTLSTLFESSSAGRNMSSFQVLHCNLLNI